MTLSHGRFQDAVHSAGDLLTERNGLALHHLPDILTLIGVAGQQAARRMQQQAKPGKAAIRGRRSSANDGLRAPALRAETGHEERQIRRRLAHRSHFTRPFRRTNHQARVPA